MKSSALLFFLVVSFSLLAQDDPVTFTVDRYSDMDASYRINSLHIDAEGRVVSSSNYGVHAMIAFESPKASLYDGNSAASDTDQFGQIWYINAEQQIQKVGGTAFDLEDLKQDKTVNHLHAWKGKIYLSTNEGMVKVDIDEPQRQVKQNAENTKLPTSPVNFCFADPNGVLWIGTNGGVCRITEKGWKVYEKKYQFTAAAYTKEGTWLASDVELWLVDKFNRWYPAAVEKKLSQGEVKAITTDKTGRVYIASEILVRYNPYTEEIIRLDADAGFINTEFSALVLDNQEQLWVGSTNQGLFRVRFGVQEEQGLLAVLSVTNGINCYGGAEGSLQIQATGGREPYLYKWSDPNLKGPFPNRLKAGAYEVVVYDALGDSTILKTQIDQPAALSVAVVSAERISDVGLRDGKAEVVGKGGTGPYQYQWSTGDTEAAINRLEKGAYTVGVIDANGCKAETQVEILKAAAMPELTNTDLEVGQTLQINELYFEADSTNIGPESYASLNEIYAFLTSNPKVQIEIGGHTNDIPPDDYCDHLSTNRAKTVANYLYAKGIRSEQVTYKGYGKRNPIASNRTEAGRKRNQRVELKVLTVE
ncbi:MAG: OmpA family protein [Bacteroidota bacterium]